MKFITRVALVAILLTEPAVQAAEVKVDAGKQHQIMHGFGTCIVTWGAPQRSPVVAGQQNPALQRMYAQDLRMNVARIPLQPWVLEGGNPWGIQGSVTEEMKQDPTQITHAAFIWKRKDGRAQGAPDYAIDWAKSLLAIQPNIKVIGSVWSPPHWMKEPAASGPGSKFHWSQNGANTCGGRLNPKYYEHYAYYLTAWAKGLKEVHGIDLYAVSVQNELFFYEPYDSCVYTPGEFAEVVGVIGKVFQKEGVKTLIMGPEDMTRYPDRTMGYVKAAMKRPVAKDALAIICAHGYADGLETSLEADDSVNLWQMMQQVCPGKEYWMTETGGGGGAWNDIESVWESGKKKGQKRIVKGALSGFATMIHNAVVHGNASVWCTWQYLDSGPQTGSGLINVGGDKPVFTKKYQVQKHFSRWTPAGCRRVEATVEGDQLLACAFSDDKTGALTLVLQNHADKAQSASLNLGSATGPFQLYITDEKCDCEPATVVSVHNGKGQIELPARSIVTLTNLTLR